MDRLGRYRILRKLGRGGMGTVYEAELEGPGGFRKPVALKVLHAGAEGLRREARIGGLLRHRHLVDVYEVGEQDGRWFLALELCTGGSLRDHLPLPPRAVVEVGLQVCEALRYAHEELALVHLDLKPDNLLIEAGDVKVADLGLAEARGFLQPPRIRGTFGYMAPEQARGRPVDARADVYALGITLVELATGSDVGAVGTADWGDAADAAGPQETPPWLSPATDRCLEPHPDDRWPDMAALAQALRELRPPGPTLREALCAVGLPVVRPVVRHTNLGEEPDAFVGRAAELAALAAGLESPCLVVLQGPAGIGKSRLAATAARRWRGATGREAWVCDVSETRSPEELSFAVATTLDVPLGRGSTDESVDQLGHALAGRGSVVLCSADGRRRAPTTPPRSRSSANGATAARRAWSWPTSGSSSARRGRRTRPSPTTPPRWRSTATSGTAAARASCSNLALADWHAGRVDEARSRFQAALQVHREVGNRRAEGSVLADLGGLDLQLGRPDDARAHLEAALVIHREVGNAVLEGDALRKLGDLYARLGRRAEAQGSYEAALRTLRAIGERRGEARVLDGLGNCHLADGRLDQARARYEAALVIHREQGCTDAGGVSLGNLGLVELREGRMDAARARLEEALEIHRASGNRRSEGLVLVNLGVVHQHQGRLDQARASLTAGLAIHREVRHRQREGSALTHLGILSLEQGRLDEARARLLSALEILREVGARRDEGMALGALGVACLEAGRVDEALAYGEAALLVDREVGNRRDEGIALAHLGIVRLEQGRTADGRALHEAALTVYREVGDRHLEGIGLVELARALALDGDLASAADAVDRAEALLTSMADTPWLDACHAVRAEVDRLASAPLAEAGGPPSHPDVRRALSRARRTIAAG